MHSIRIESVDDDKERFEMSTTSPALFTPRRRVRSALAILTALALSVPLAVLSATPASADDLEKMWFSKAATGSAVIDGDLDASYADTVTLVPERWKNSLISEVSGEISVLWDATYLYVYADVVDDVVDSVSANSWERDSVEIFIEEDNGRKDIYGAGDSQVRIGADGAVFVKSGSNLLTVGEVDAWAETTLTGYIVEARIPWQIISPVEDQVIGFDAQINDADALHTRAGLLGWNDYRDRAGNYPQDMGQLQLVDGPTSSLDTELVDYPPTPPAIPPVDFSSTTVVDPGEVQLTAFENAEPVTNPDKGWVLYGDTGNWGRPGQLSAEALALGTVGYYRFNWYEIEPEEDEYNWDIIDDTIEAWDAIGKTFAFGVINANTARPGVEYVTPEWVEDAGAEFVDVDIEFNLDDTVHGTQMVPVWDDPIYISKLDDFIDDLAARYDGDPRVEFIDIRSYGNYGEDHVWGISESTDPARRSQLISDNAFQTLHIDTYLEHFTQTQLMLPRGNSIHEDVFAGAGADGIGLRFDGAVAAYPLYMADAAQQAPGVYEFVGSYGGLKASNQWSDDALLRSIPQGNPTWMGLGQWNGDADLFLADKRDLIHQISNLVGYHFVLNDIVLPELIDAGVDTDVILNWANKGFAHRYDDAEIALAILDSSGAAVDVYWQDDLDPLSWQERTVNEETGSLDLEPLADGTYSLAVGMFTDKADTVPDFQIGNRGKLSNGWYVVTNNVVVDDDTYTFASETEAPISVVIDGRMLALDHRAVVGVSDVLLPLVETFEALGADVDVSGSTVTVTVANQDPVALTVGSGGVSDLGGVIMIESAVVNSVIPAVVVWDDVTRTVTITPIPIEPEFSASHEWQQTPTVLRSADLAFDSDLNTSWVADFSAGQITVNSPVWVQHKFDDPITFDTVDITESAGPTAGEIGDFEIQYWDDDAWATAYSGSDLSTGTKGDTYTFRFPAVTTTKMRLLVTSATVGWVNVREIVLSQQPEFSASHQWQQTPTVLRSASLAFDSNLGTSWVADANYNLISAGNPVSVQHTFDEPLTFDSVEITESAGLTAGEIGNFKIQYWANGGWVTAYTGTDATSGAKGSKTTFTFTEVTSLKVRLLVESATVGWVNVCEITPVLQP